MARAKGWPRVRGRGEALGRVYCVHCGLGHALPKHGYEIARTFPGCQRCTLRVIDGETLLVALGLLGDDSIACATCGTTCLGANRFCFTCGADARARGHASRGRGASRVRRRRSAS